MRYDHISPQYQRLMEKIEEQEQQIVCLEENSKFSSEGYRRTLERLYKIEKEVAEFNSLPWYRKMLYKFEGLWLGL